MGSLAERSLWGGRSTEIFRIFASTFFLFVQRLHQFHTLAEIGDYIARGIAKVRDLKDFWHNLSCQIYANALQVEEEQSFLEAAFPSYSEKEECGADKTWSDCKFGRIPEFIYSDASSLLLTPEKDRKTPRRQKLRTLRAITVNSSSAPCNIFSSAASTISMKRKTECVLCRNPVATNPNLRNASMGFPGHKWSQQAVRMYRCCYTKVLQPLSNSQRQEEEA